MVRADFDEMGMLVKKGFILKDAFLEAYGHPAYYFWKVLEDHIENERKKRDNRHFMENFEFIAMEAFKYWLSKKGSPLQGPDDNQSNDD